MVEATQKFAEINVTVRSQERRLRQDLHKDALADSLSALQKGEEAKLRFTLIQQVCTGSFIRPQNAPSPLRSMRLPQSTQRACTATKLKLVYCS